MEKLVFGFDISLLRDADGREITFEEARAKQFFRKHQRFPSVSEEFPPPNPSALKHPPEAPLVVRYARKLMAQDNALYLENAWGDPFTSAEVYLQLRALRNQLASEAFNTSLEPLTPQVHFISRRRRVSSIIFDDDEEEEIGVSPRKQMFLGDGNVTLVADGEHEEQTENAPPASPSAAADSVDAARQSEVPELPSSKAMGLLLRRRDHHLIDVSNYLPESSPGTSAAVATQLFSPRQVRELLLRPNSASPVLKTSPDDDGEEGPACGGVDPWCARFTDVFWNKIALRVSTWSSYYPIEPQKPPRAHITFGKQKYTLEDRLGAGTYGVVFLARLMADGTSSTTTATSPAVLDATTVGCCPEQLQREQTSSNKGTAIVRVVKREVPENPLEFYHMREARRRVASAFRAGRIAVDVRPSICPALALTHSPQKFTCLLMPFYPVGLLTLLNYGAFMSAADGKPSRAARGDRRRPAPLERHEEELVALYLTLELLWLAEALHKCAGMIHGDIKPDNFRLNDRMPLLDVSELDEEEERQESGPVSSGILSGSSTKVLVLLDFGMCVDMARFPPETVFMVHKSTSAKRSFPCIEMLTGRPWTFQLDLFNIAGVIYTLVFKRYMKVEYSEGQWKPEFMPRSNRLYRAIDVWRSILSSLLNVPSCAPEDYPDLSALRTECQHFLCQNALEYNMAAERANSIIAYLMMLTSL